MVKYKNKLEQAKYNFRNMEAKLKDSIFEHFAFELCSFIESARNITWAMQEELAEKSGFEDWYSKKQEYMRKDQIFDFFNKKRIDVTKKGSSGHDGFTFYIEFTVTVPAGQKVVNYTVEFPKEISSTWPEIKATTDSGEQLKIKSKTIVTPVFPELKNRHVIEVCQEYLAKMESLVEEAEKIFN